MKLKFCGLTREADITAVNETKPDYIGFVFADSRRRVTDAQAARLRAQLAAGIQAVGVFVRDDPAHIAALANGGTIDLIQLHGGEDAEYIAALRRLTDKPIVYAVRVRERADIVRAAALEAEYLLLDTYVKGVAGGSGQAFDWSLIGETPKPYFLAGGLTESNIPQAMQTGAYALDLSSGIETDGIKDAGKMRRIAALVKGGKP